MLEQFIQIGQFLSGSITPFILASMLSVSEEYAQCNKTQKRKEENIAASTLIPSPPTAAPIGEGP